MRLRKLFIKNYKSIRELEVDDLQDVNVFIGKNDAGKSNILGAMDILFNANLQNYNRSLVLKEEDDLDASFEGSSTYLFFNKKQNEAEITAYLSASQKELEKMGFKVDSDDNELVFSRRIISSGETTRLSLDFIRINKTIVMKSAGEKARFLDAKGGYVSDVSKSLVPAFMDKIFNELVVIPADRNIVRSPTQSSEKTHVENYIKQSLIDLVNSDDGDKKALFSQFVDFIDKISPLIEKVEPVLDKKKVVDLKFRTSAGDEIPLSIIGGGNNELLLLLHEIIVSGGLMMIIEEPEIHLHPQAERKLYKFIEQFSATTQMFVVTHSSVFVQPSNIRGLVRVVKEKGETKAYGMGPGEHINRDRLEQELNAENCEMFFADKVLLVEGISDKIFMEGLIDRRCKSTDEIKVVSAYSKDNFEIYVDLLKIFRIPYIVMTDLDALKGHFQIKIIWNEIKHEKLDNRDARIAFLKTKGIHVLSRGALESCYPSQYRKGVSKPLDALLAIHSLTDAEYNCERMRDLRDVIHALEK